VTRHTLHIPEQLNDGTPVAPEYLETVESRLIDLGGGFTLTHGIGAWRSDDGTIYREPVRLYHVDTADDVRIALADLAERVSSVLDQEAVYVTEQDITTSLVYA